MKNIPDELFRRKLEHLQTPPPARAWEKIERGMRRKRITPWLAVAASLLLAVSASALIITQQMNSDRRDVAARNRPNTQTTPDTSSNKEVLPQPEQNTKTPAVNRATPQVNPVPEAPATSESIPDETVAANNTPPVNDTMPDVDNETKIDASEAIEDSIPTMIAEASDDDRTSVKIVLEADAVQARYLKKKSRGDATDEVAKASGLRKLLDKAEQIHNEDPIGDLRQMKNEIFALNFSGKKRDQNK